MTDTELMLVSLGVTLPTPAYLIAVLLFSVIGIVAFYKGRRAKRRAVTWLGVALMLYPYIVWGTVPVYIVGVVLSATAWWAWKRDSSAASGAALQYVLIIHEVADYPAWKKIFDAAAGIRRAAGERSYQVLKYEQDTNRIVHFSAWTSASAAKVFFESPKLVQIRREAGVKAPDFIYLDLLEAGSL